jgi:hypothetical protein
MIGSTSLPEFDQDEPILAGPAPAISPRTPGRPAAGSNPRTPRTLPRPSPGPRELLPPRASRAAAIGRVPQALPQRQVIRGGGHLLAYVLRRAGSHVALFDGDFARCSISARSSLRNRAQSARRSSDTNSPGGSGWGSRGDPASGAGPNTESPPRCGNCGKSCFCNRRRRARTSKSRRRVDSTVVRAAVGSPERVTLRRSSERARTLLGGTETQATALVAVRDNAHGGPEWRKTHFAGIAIARSTRLVVFARRTLNEGGLTGAAPTALHFAFRPGVSKPPVPLEALRNRSTSEPSYPPELSSFRDS